MRKEDLKIVFFGTPEFAVASLDRLYKGGYNIAGVVTMPDKPAGRGHKLLFSPIKQYALEHGLRLMQPVNLKSPEFVEELKSIAADLFIVIAFRMLPEVVWAMPPLGTFNLHASLLPKYRGAAPINWAVINGDDKTGVTTFFLKHEIDTGDIIDQVAVDILPDDNVGDVHDRLMELGAELTVRTVDRIIGGNLSATPQDELTAGIEPTSAPKIFKETCLIDWRQPAVKVNNLVRGLSPYPAAWTQLLRDGESEPVQMKVFETSPGEATALAPGTIKISDGHLFVACSDRLLEIKSLQLAGRKRMSASDFLRGCDLSASRIVMPD